MSTQSTMTAPFTKAVVGAMRRLYPEALADKSFDNTGLLLEAPYIPSRPQKNSVLLTVDLTKAVADEAIKRRDSCIVAYHPIIFRGLKSLTLDNTQQQSLLRLAAEGISVYSPHTAIDAAPGGLGDWLADIVSGVPSTQTGRKGGDNTTKSSKTGQNTGNVAADTARSTYQLQHHPFQPFLQEESFKLGASEHKRYPIKAVNVNGIQGAGMGRVVHLDNPISLTEMIDRIGLAFGNPKGFPIAIPQGKQASDIVIKSIAVCAGSGGHLFSEMDKDDETVDLLFTGEMSHHEALAAIEKGQCVISLFHSNTERGFLHTVLKGQLEEAIPEEIETVRKMLNSVPGSDDLGKALKDGSFQVHVSEVDRDPYGIMVRKDN